MRVLLLSVLIFGLSCASNPQRQLASIEPIVEGKVDQRLSGISSFLSDQENPSSLLFYMDLKSFSVQDKTLKHKVRTIQRPSKSKSKFLIISNKNHELVVQLFLKDKKGNFVDLQYSPEIMIEGAGTLNDLVMVKNGLWQFRVTFSEDNHILYFSVRANGVYLERLLRFQHLEK